MRRKSRTCWLALDGALVCDSARPHGPLPEGVLAWCDSQRRHR